MKSSIIYSPFAIMTFAIMAVHNRVYLSKSFTFNTNCKNTRLHGKQESSTRLYLEDHIADMIDLELLRLTNKREYEKQRREKNKAVAEQSLPSNFESGDFFNVFKSNPDQESIEKRRDRRMATNSPEQYCADRCVSTGHCDVYEDMFEMGPEEVIKFCKECVLSDDEEPCDIPDKMLDSDHPKLSLRP